MRAAPRDALVALTLALVTSGVFSRALECGFVNFDDGTYVEANPDVLNGLTPGGVARAWISFRASNWHPLTWLSLQLDATILGTSARGFHLTNVLLHAANAAVLFLALRSLTGCVFRSAIVAALFAVHPLRVESVAWVSERKDVLGTFFGFLSLWAYAAYAKAPCVGRYFYVVFPLALSLLAKPMLVTLPFLLFVLDWWPLGRASSPRIWLSLVLEKLPLLALCLGSCIVTFIAQRSGRSMADLGQVTPAARLANAAVAYAIYLWLAVWPFRLTVYYPLPSGGWTGEAVAVSAFVVLGLTVLAIWQRRSRPYLLAGWLWYAGTLVPVIGLVQVGDQAYADRYTYFPLVGPALALVWAVAEAAGRERRWIALTGAAAAVAGMAVLSWIQIGFWKDSLTLWDRNYAVCGPTEKSLINRGNVYVRLGRIDKASSDFEEAVRIKPTSAVARANLGAALLQRHRLEEAAEQLDIAKQLDPRFFESPEKRTRLGFTLWLLGRDEEAMRYMGEAVRSGPNEPTAHYYLGLAFSDLGRYDEAAGEFAAAARLDGHSLIYRLALAAALDHAGKDASSLVRQISRSDARWAMNIAREAKGIADASGATPREGRHASEVARLACKYSTEKSPELYGALAAAYARAELFPEAVSAAEKGLAVAESSGRPELARELADRLTSYRRGQPTKARTSVE